MKPKACVVVVFALALLIAAEGARAASDSSRVQELADRLQELTIRAKLVDQLGIDAVSIGVTVEGKSVTLTGGVPTQSMRDAAPDVALTVKGVTIVQNRIAVTGGPGVAQRTERELKDAALELRVKSALLLALGSDALDIDVDAVDGVVVLRGDASAPGSSERASSVASGVEGVKKVINILG